MKIKVRLTNHGLIDNVMREGGEVVIIDEEKFTETWMRRLESVEEHLHKKNLIERIFRKP